MYTKEITSLQHPIVKHLVKLRKNRRYRHECGSLLLEGKKMIEEYQGPIETLLTTTPTRLSAKKYYLITQEILEKISGTVSPEPFLAEVFILSETSLIQHPYILALDGISDPGNLGTLLRTALALGFNGVFITKESADPYSSKALRAAKGATFHLSLKTGTIKDLLTFSQENNYSLYVADTKGKYTLTFDTPLILVLGNETTGPSLECKTFGSLVSIPTSHQTESLNVAIAGGILMHTIRAEI